MVALELAALELVALESAVLELAALELALESPAPNRFLPMSEGNCSHGNRCTQQGLPHHHKQDMDSAALGNGHKEPNQYQDTVR